MDVNEIKKVADPSVTTKNTEQFENTTISSAKKANSLSAGQVVSQLPKDEMKLERRKVKDYSINQTLANQVINSLNVADDAASEIDRLVKSVEGIVKQVDKGNIPDNRRNVLDREAKELVSAIKQQSEVDLSPISEIGDSDTKVEIEHKLEQSLKTLFREGSESAFGLGAFQLDPKENIINVRTSVALAREKVESLRDKVSEAKDQIKHTITALEVAHLNSESAESTVRDVDKALQLASNTGNFITKHPETAVSANRLKPSALELLE